MKKIDRDRIKKLAGKLGYSYEELSAKGIEAMLESIDGKDGEQMPTFLLEIRKRKKEFEDRNNSGSSS